MKKVIILAALVSAVALGACRKEVAHKPMKLGAEVAGRVRLLGLTGAESLAAIKEAAGAQVEEAPGIRRVVDISARLAEQELSVKVEPARRRSSQ